MPRTSLLALALLLACTSAPARQAAVAAPPAPAAHPTFDAVVLVSVDGLRSDALLVEPEKLPAFARLLHGAHTLNARTDPDWTVTLPNHTGMVTGRLVAGPGGHGWTRNDEADEGETIQANKGAYVASIFDVAHDRGAWTGIYTGKPKFRLFQQSWDGEHAAPDAVPPDDGQNKVDAYAFREKTAEMVDEVLAGLSAAPAGKRRLLFVHFAIADIAAHAHGWDLTPGSPYLKAVGEVDAGLGRILDALDANAALKGRSAVVLTADHGGGAPYKSHDRPQMWVDYIIPFVVWTGGGESADLYALNAGRRREPGISRPMPADPGPPPIRNGDSGNLVLELLGMPAVPGSTVNAAQDLDVFAAPKR